MGEVITPSDLRDIIKALQADVAEIQRRNARFPNYTLATRPAASSVAPGSPIFVTDAPDGQRFQGSDGTNWKALG